MSGANSSKIIVALQLILMLFIFLSGHIIPRNPIYLVLFLTGVFLGIWAVYSFRSTRFSISPQVAKNASLITSGPYQYIRHPMYSAVILVCFSLVANSPTLERIIALIILTAVLIYKTSMEEKFLHNHFKEYGIYVKKTKKLIPFIY